MKTCTHKAENERDEAKKALIKTQQSDSPALANKFDFL